MNKHYLLELSDFFLSTMRWSKSVINKVIKCQCFEYLLLYNLIDKQSENLITIEVIILASLTQEN